MRGLRRATFGVWLATLATLGAFGLALMGGAALPLPLRAQPAEGGPLLGYAVGLDRVLVLDLDAFKRLKTVIGGAEVRTLSTSPKFGPDGRIYIGDAEARGLHALDPRAPAFVDFLPVDGEPNDFEILASARRPVALVNDFAGRRVLLVDLASKRALGAVAVDGPAANEIAVAPDGKRVYVTTFNFEEAIPHEASHPLVALDVVEPPDGGPVTLRPAKTLPLHERLDGETIPYMASSVDVSSDGRRVYVLAVDDYEENPEVFVVDAQRLEVVEVLPVDLGRRAREPFVNVLALSPDDRTLGIAAFRNGLALMDVETGETRVLKPEHPRLSDPIVFGVTFGPQGQLYAVGAVAGGAYGFVVEFDPRTGEQLNVLLARLQPLLYLGVPGGKTF